MAQLSIKRVIEEELITEFKINFVNELLYLRKKVME